MKKIITIALLLISINAVAQPKSTLNLIEHADGTEVKPCEYYVTNPCRYIPKGTTVGDTLIIPLGKYQHIKIGDKVYKINTTLEEVQPQPIWQGTLQSTLPLYQNYNGSGGGLITVDTSVYTLKKPIKNKK